VISDDLIATVATALETGSDLGPALTACMSGADGLDAAGKRELLRGLGELIRQRPVEGGGRNAICAGAIIERGANPADFPVAVFERIAEMLDALPRATAPAGADGRDEESDDEQELPETYYHFERAAIACLARSAHVRREQRIALSPRIRRYSETYGFLGKMLSLLDNEPLLVLDVPTGRAWRVVIDGIADNFQLHTLLVGALARAPSRWPSWLCRRAGLEGIAGSPLHPRIVAASSSGPAVDLPAFSSWQLATWRALETGGRLEPGHDHWIWNEGVPADIEPLDGTRLILVAPGTIERSWNSGRVFPMVEGSLRMERQLPDEEAADIVERILACTRGTS